jgi:putative ABC transport system substrate-binding protein
VRPGAQRRALLGAGCGLAAAPLRPWSMLAAAGASVAASLPPRASAQAPGKVHRIGYLSVNFPAAVAHLIVEFRQGMRDLGYQEGRNLLVEYRYAQGSNERLAEMAAELVALRVELIVTAQTASAVAAHQATRSIPIVAVTVADPVRLGLAASLARPGGNVTGIAFGVELDSVTKGLQLLNEALPAARRVAVLSNPGNPLQPAMTEKLTAAARPLGLQLRWHPAREPEDLGPAFAAMVRERAAAVLVLADGLFLRNRDRLAELALKHGLPTMHGVREFTEAGGLLSFGPSLRAQPRRAAVYVHKILQGARPGDLPIEQPTTFELVVNLKTAKTLGIVLPQSLLLRADEVIE